MVINISEFAHKGHAHFFTDGIKISKDIEKCLSEKKPLVLSFQDIESFTYSFLNAMLGSSYCEYSEEEINQRITVSEITPELQTKFDIYSKEIRWRADNRELHAETLERALSGNYDDEDEE
jgi:hypothetical protein